MKKTRLFGGLLFFMTALLLPVSAAQAKEIPENGSIPLTTEYFLNERFAKSMAWYYDRDGDGFLSPEEIAQVTKIHCAWNLPDLSPLQYFTNLKELELETWDGDESYGIWVGTELDLTMFPDLEKAWIYLDSKQAPDGSQMVRINASGLDHLKSIKVFDSISRYDDVNIASVDLRDTPALETVRIHDTGRVFFDDENRIREISLWNIKEVPSAQIGGFTNLECLDINADLEEFQELDVSGCQSMNSVVIENSYFKTLKTVGADRLEKIQVNSDAMEAVDVSQNQMLRELRLECPRLGEVHVGKNEKLNFLEILSERIRDIDLKRNKALERLYICSDKLESLDTAKNKKLEFLNIDSDSITRLNIKKNRKLERLSVTCGRVGSLDLSANTKLTGLYVDGTPLKSLDLSKQKNLTLFYFQNNKTLAKLDLSKNILIRHLEVENTALKSLDVSGLTKLYMVGITGNKKLTKLDLSANKKVADVRVNNNALKTLKLGIKTSMDCLDCSNNALKTLKLGTKERMEYLNCSKNKLKTLDLSKVAYIDKIVCDKKVKVKGYKGKITRV